MGKSSKRKRAEPDETLAPKAADVAPVVTATLAYENWLRASIDVVEADLEVKHKDMASSLFSFFRATFYRFVPLWLATCPELVETPKLLAVGDLHVENFGTWRDTEGRLIWGVNDFDETANMPYAIDLVRLVASAIIAKEVNGLTIEAADAAAFVLAGYAATMEAGGAAFVLEENHPSLREMALTTARAPTQFWPKLIKLPAATPPKRVQRLLQRWLPDGSDSVAYTTRIAGEGSLGRPRYVATAQCNGGLVAREVKSWLPSAWGWARGNPKDQAFALQLLKRAVRESDPFYSIEQGWVVRRLGPYCSRIELSDFPAHRDEKAILKAMGQETANLHLGTRDRREAVLKDLGERQPNWLLDAGKAMVKATTKDWTDFKASTLAKSGTPTSGTAASGTAANAAPANASPAS